MKFVRILNFFCFAIWALHLFLPMIQAGEDHSQTSCKQCSCLQRSHQESRSATTFLTGVNITVLLGWRTMKIGNSFMVSWCLIAFINFTSLSCQHVGWYKAKQSHNCAGMCLVVGATEGPEEGDAPPKGAFPADITWAVLAQRAEKGTSEDPEQHLLLSLSLLLPNWDQGSMQELLLSFFSLQFPFCW